MRNSNSQGETVTAHWRTKDGDLRVTDPLRTVLFEPRSGQTFRTGTRLDTRRTKTAVTVFAMTLLIACGSDDGDASAPTTTTVPTTTATVERPATTTTTTTLVGTDTDCTGRQGTSSRADFDPQAGQYAVYLREVDPGGRTVAFDVVQFLVGDDAARAYRRDHPDDPSGPPNDYYIVNQAPRTDEAALTGSARVRLLNPRMITELIPGTLADILDHLVSPDSERSLGLYWLAFAGGQVTDVCEQYTP